MIPHPYNTKHKTWLSVWLCFARKINCLCYKSSAECCEHKQSLSIEQSQLVMSIVRRAVWLFFNIEQIVGMLMRAYLLRSKVSVQRADAHKVEISSLKDNL